MNKWSGRENNGNHPIRTADRKTNESTEGPKQDEPKQTHTKTYHN